MQMQIHVGTILLHLNPETERVAVPFRGHGHYRRSGFRLIGVGDRNLLGGEEFVRRKRHDLLDISRSVSFILCYQTISKNIA